MILSVTPPATSIPSESGVTSSSSIFSRGFGTAAKDVGLHGRAESDNFVGIQSGVRFAVKQFFHESANLGNARRSTDQDDFVDLFGLEIRVLESLLARADGAIDDRAESIARTVRE